MANQAKYTKISEEDLSDAPKGRWLKAITEPLSEQLTVNKGLMDGGLTFSDNIMSESKTFDVEVPDPWVAPTLLNAYANVGGATDPPAGYMKYADGSVGVRGFVTGGAGVSAVFTLPVGHRPAYNVVFATSSNAVFSTISIQPDGNIIDNGVTGLTVNIHCRFMSSDATPIKNSRFPIFLLTDFTSPVLGVIITKIEDMTTGQPMPIGCVSHLDWEYVNASGKPNIKINNVCGLPYNRKYRIKVLILGN